MLHLFLGKVSFKTIVVKDVSVVFCQTTEISSEENEWTHKDISYSQTIPCCKLKDSCGPQLLFLQ